ncbi:MAG: hypothetical protein FJZ89_11650 [Chloroflexi bacterium]|nr:hypothetical protein [Chloroflexota bacterium]
MSMSLSQLIVYLMVAAICGYVGQALVRRKMPGGLAGAAAALVGAWLSLVVTRSGFESVACDNQRWLLSCTSTLPRS